jgi:hypothetical protein
MTKKYLTLPAVMAGALGMGSTIAWAAEPTTDELLEKIEQLQAKVDQLETKQAQQPTTVTASDADATLQKVLDDAQKRSQLFQAEGFTAGWDNGFKLGSADGNYTLNPYFQLQVRNVTNYRDDIGGGDEDLQNGFEIRRAKFGVKGNAFTPDFTYDLRWETDEDGGSVSLEQATVAWQFSDDWAFMLGQFKDNWTHEETTSSSRQLAADRSLLNELIGGGVTDFVQGVALMYNPQDSQLRAMFAFHDGFNTDNTNFVEHGGGGGLPSGPAVSPNFGISARAEYAFMGDFKQYEDFTARGNDDDMLVVGAGGDWTQDGGTNIYFHTIDAQWENAGGLGIYGAYVGAFTDTTVAGADDTYDVGFLVQAGYMLNEDWEIFGRYDLTILDDENLPAGSEDNFNEFTAGVNYYWEGHRGKFTLDFVFLPDGVPAGTGSGLSGIGLLEGVEGEDQFAIRGQFQLLL